MVKEEYFQKLWLGKFSWFVKVVLSLMTSLLLCREIVECILFSRCRTALPLAIVVVESPAKLEAIWEVLFGVRICSTDEKHDSWFHDTAVYSFAQLADEFADGAYILGSSHVSKSKTTDWLMLFPGELYFRAYFRTWRHCRSLTRWKVCIFVSLVLALGCKDPLVWNANSIFCRENPLLESHVGWLMTKLTSFKQVFFISNTLGFCFPSNRLVQHVYQVNSKSQVTSQMKKNTAIIPIP